MVLQRRKNLWWIASFLWLPPALFAQEEHPMLRALVSFAPGYLTNQKTTTYGIGGELELYPDSATPLTAGGKISIRFDGYALMAKSTTKGLQQNHQALLGIAYNFEKLGMLSPFIGFQPGLGFAQVEAPSYSLPRMMAVFSPFMGFHYFAENVFHLSFHVRYVFGELNYPQVGSQNLGEVRAAAGFGIFF